MLVITRKIGERVRIGKDVEVVVVGFKGNKIKLGIDAPRSVQVLREELVDRCEKRDEGGEA